MHAYVFIVLVFISARQTQTALYMESVQGFFENQTMNVKAFFEEQKNSVEKAFKESYEDAMRIKNSVTNYVDVQQKKIGSNINSYVESVKESSRKVADSWSYLPIEEAGARMENPDVLLSVPAIITRNGYSCETHTVLSQGYLINVHRIPYPRTGGKISKKAILLHHGLFGSSADWILNGPEKALGYVLADAGYDVWMANVRGNKYSKEHISLRSDSKSFWNFSWHEVALHDVPAIIDHILKVKGEGTTISYIGHSMGTTILFAMLTLRPEYNDILKAGIALAPVAFMSDMKSPLKSLAPIASNVAYMEMLYGSHEFIPKDSILGKMTKSCKVDNMDTLMCKNIIFYICGYNENQFDKNLLPMFVSNLGTGTSWKTAVHFAQEIIANGSFQQFDYGSKDNQRVYGCETPPQYDLSKIKLPITLFWAENDLLSSEKDVKLLYEMLPSSKQIYKISDPEFNHLDYLWAIDAPTLVNEEVINTLNRVYSPASVSNNLFGQIFGKGK